jgi:hypothetical protein
MISSYNTSLYKDANNNDLYMLGENGINLLEPALKKLKGKIIERELL